MSSPSGPPTTFQPSTNPRITWDEDAILLHESEAGVVYGTQRVDEVSTPFLYSGVETPGDGTDSAGGNQARTVGEHVPGVGRCEVDVGELRARLGVCLNAMRDPPPPWLKMKSRSEDPGETFYFNPATNVTSWEFPEDEIGAGAGATADEDEEEGVRAREVKRCGEGDVNEGGATAVGAEGEVDEEDEPIVPSRLTKAQDCAAQYASKQR